MNPDEPGCASETKRYCRYSNFEKCVFTKEIIKNQKVDFKTRTKRLQLKNLRLIVTILLILTSVILLIDLYWILARYTDLIYDSLLEKGKWGNVSVISIFISGLISLTILFITLKFLNPVSRTVKIYKTLKTGLFTSLFFILLATMFWSDSWTGSQSIVLDSRELGDAIWKLGHPLTFLIIDFPIYLRNKFENLQALWSDYWAYPSVLILFVIQFSIYIHGLRMIINYKKIKNCL